MSDNVKLLCPRGTTYYRGRSTMPTTHGKADQFLGQTARFVDTDPVLANSANASRTVLTGLWCYGVFVKNVSGTTMKAGQPVLFSTTNIYQDVDDGVSAFASQSNTEILAGFVDDHLPYTVADDDCFWCFYKGPQLVNSEDTNIVVGRHLMATAVATSAEDDGVALLAKTDTDDQTDEILEWYTNVIGRAMEGHADTATNKVRVMLNIQNGL